MSTEGSVVKTEPRDFPAALGRLHGIPHTFFTLNSVDKPLKVLLISANTEKAFMSPLPLGLNCVAVAAREAGYEVELIDLMGSDNCDSIIRRAVERVKPQVIGLSVRNVDDQKMVGTRFLLDPVRDAVGCCRKYSDALIVLGGAGYSIFPDAVLKYLGADMGICGEGEASFPALLDAIQHGRPLSGIPGLLAPRFGIRKSCAIGSVLDALPLPDPDLWSVPPGDPELWVPFQTRRGCPMNCSYCSTSTLEGARIRRRSLATVVASISRHVAAGYDHFYFVDNVFNIPLDYAKSLCEAFTHAALEISWRCILYPGFIDEELVRGMAEAGCVEASLGFESGSTSVLRSMNKKYSVNDVREASATLRRYGISRAGFLLLGGPGETKDSVKASLAFAESLDLEMLKVSTGIRIYPGTELERIAKAEGVISADDDLLIPRFYLAKGLEPWLEETVREWAADRPGCIT